jgi:hypothetical protein
MLLLQKEEDKKYKEGQSKGSEKILFVGLKKLDKSFVFEWMLNHLARCSR